MASNGTTTFRKDGSVMFKASKSLAITFEALAPKGVQIGKESNKTYLRLKDLSIIDGSLSDDLASIQSLINDFATKSILTDKASRIHLFPSIETKSISVEVNGTYDPIWNSMSVFPHLRYTSAYEIDKRDTKINILKWSDQSCRVIIAANVKTINYEISQNSTEEKPMVRATPFLNVSRIVFIPLYDEELASLKKQESSEFGGVHQEKKFWDSVDSLRKGNSKKRLLVENNDQAMQISQEDEEEKEMSKEGAKKLKKK